MRMVTGWANKGLQRMIAPNLGRYDYTYANLACKNLGKILYMYSRNLVRFLHGPVKCKRRKISLCGNVAAATCSAGSRKDAKRACIDAHASSKWGQRSGDKERMAIDWV
ncbi:hypothetical protein BaRGS_00016447 [Batillaria attramentaria]|uniref:Uncharacterized protein n=1 Tax=Batillaria attramentaria TaxID=370345 RepID=A0ABD0KYW6_9CAEN